MERLAIFGALKWECGTVLRQLRQVSRRRIAECVVWTAQTPAGEVWLVKTGMGNDRAARAARAIAALGPFDLFLSTGCAGGLAPDLVPGDLVIGTTVIDHHDGQRIETDPTHRERARRAADRAALPLWLGPMLCTQVLMTAAEKEAACAQTGALAVDMEGSAIAEVALEARIPFAAVRAILDAATTEVDVTAPFVDAQTGAVKPLALARYVVTHPQAIAYLRAMQRMMRAAQASLEKFFAAFLVS